ncbi:MAG: hypothetical protein ACK4M7_11070, partial [Burkholderiales bacterium]
GRYVSRTLKNTTFGGAAFTANPADKEAYLLAVASNKKEGKELFPKLETELFADAVGRTLPIDTKLHTKASLENFEKVFWDPNEALIPPPLVL